MLLTLSRFSLVTRSRFVYETNVGQQTVVLKHVLLAVIERDSRIHSQFLRHCINKCFTIPWSAGTNWITFDGEAELGSKRSHKLLEQKRRYNNHPIF